MNRTRWIPICVILLLAATRMRAGETDTVTRVALTLIDGSRVLGISKAATLKVEWEGRELNLELALLKQIQLTGRPAKAQLRFVNGDKMEAALKSDSFPVETLFGTHQIKAELVRTADFFVSGKKGIAPEEGLLLYYSFDNVTGDRVPDLSGNSNDGKINGAKVVHGKFGSAMEFSRKTDNVEVKDIPGLKFGVDDDVTLALWWNGTGDLRHVPLLTKYLAAGHPEGRGFCLITLPPEGYYIPAYMDCYARFTVSLSTGEWHYVAVVKKGRAWCVHHDGNELPIGRTMAWPCQEISVDAPLLIGGSDAPDWPPFNGCIDEVRIYNRALSADEIKALAEKR